MTKMKPSWTHDNYQGSGYHKDGERVLTFYGVFCGRAPGMYPEVTWVVVALCCQEGLSWAHKYIGGIVGEITLNRRLNCVGSFERTSLVFQIYSEVEKRWLLLVSLLKVWKAVGIITIIIYVQFSTPWGQSENEMTRCLPSSWLLKEKREKSLWQYRRGYHNHVSIIVETRYHEIVVKLAPSHIYRHDISQNPKRRFERN